MDTTNKIDECSLNRLCENNNIKNLVQLSADIDLCVFNKKYNKWNVKPKDKLLKECEKIKKSEVKNVSYKLANLAKLSSNNIDIDPLYNKIKNIDTVINYINNTDINIDTIKKNKIESEKYIESYSNC